MKKPCADLKRIFREQFFDLFNWRLIHQFECTLFAHYLLAGVAALAGTAEEWILVEEHLQLRISHVDSGSGPLKACAMLRKAQGSGKTKWNDYLANQTLSYFCSRLQLQPD